MWLVAWAGLVTLPLASGLLLHNQVRPTAQTLKSWLTVWGRMVLAGAGIKLHVETRGELHRDCPVVLVANHQNTLDIVTCAAGIPHPYGFAAKEEIRSYPVIGTIVERTACLFVDRSTARRAAESVREAAQLIRGGNSVLIYPEGERTFGPAMVPFLRGAFLLAVEAGVPLVPVVQIGNDAVADERRWVSRPGNIKLVVCEPISTEGATRKDIPALMEAVREVIERELVRAYGQAALSPPARSAGASVSFRSISASDSA